MTDGIFASTGTVQYWAVVGVDALHAHGSTQAVEMAAGASFKAPAFDIVMRQR